MSLSGYFFNFVGSSVISYGIVKYGLKQEPGYAILIGSALGTLICMAFLGVR